MKNKKSRLSGLLFLMVAILSLLLTFELIRVDKEEAVVKEKREITRNISGSFLTGNTPGNLLQHDKKLAYGQTVIYGNDIYMVEVSGDGKALYKLDATSYEEGKEDNKTLLLTAKNIRSLHLVGDFIYGIIDLEDVGSRIGKIYLPTGEVTYIDTSRSSYISSLILDDKYVYYTVKNDSYIYRLNSDDSVKKLIDTNPNEGYPHLLGLVDKKLYYTNGSFLYSLSLNNLVPKAINANYSSLEQYPLVTSAGIIAMDSINPESIDLLDMDGNFIEKLVVLKENEVEEVKSINYIDNYLFINTGKAVFYKNIKGGEIKKIEDIEFENAKNMFLSDRYLVLEKEDSEGLVLVRIAWIFSS